MNVIIKLQLFVSYRGVSCDHLTNLKRSEIYSVCFLLQVPIDSCLLGAQHSAFLQQVGHISCFFNSICQILLHHWFIGVTSLLIYWSIVMHFCATGFLHNWGCVSEAPTTRWPFPVSLGKLWPIWAIWKRFSVVILMIKYFLRAT